MVPHSVRPFSGPTVATICLVCFLFDDDQPQCKPHCQGDEPDASGSLFGHLETETFFTVKLQLEPSQI